MSFSVIYCAFIKNNLILLVFIPAGIKTEVCTSGDFAIRCSNGDLLLMQKALLGRMETGRCLQDNLGYIGCHKNVLKKLDGLCSGHPECKIPKITNNDFDQIAGIENECPKGLESYLETEHICVQGEWNVILF